MDSYQRADQHVLSVMYLSSVTNDGSNRTPMDQTAWDDVSGKMLDKDKVRKARQEEIE